MEYVYWLFSAGWLAIAIAVTLDALGLIKFKSHWFAQVAGFCFVVEHFVQKAIGS